MTEPVAELRGESVTFVNRAFGSKLFSGGTNVLLWSRSTAMLTRSWSLDRAVE